MNNSGIFTNKDDTTIKDNWGKLSCQQIADKLILTKWQVYHRAIRVLGLPKLGNQKRNVK